MAELSVSVKSESVDIVMVLVVLVGTKYLVASTWYQVLGTKYLVPSTWYKVLGTKYLVQTTWYQVLGTSWAAGAAQEVPGAIRQLKAILHFGGLGSIGAALGGRQ